MPCPSSVTTARPEARCFRYEGVQLTRRGMMQLLSTEPNRSVTVLRLRVLSRTARRGQVCKSCNRRDLLGNSAGGIRTYSRLTDGAPMRHVFAADRFASLTSRGSVKRH